MLKSYKFGLSILLAVILPALLLNAQNNDIIEDDDQNLRESRQGFAGNEDYDNDDSTNAPVNIGNIGNGVIGVVTSALTGQFGNAITGGLNLINNRNNAVNNLFATLGVTDTPQPTPKSNVTANPLNKNGTTTTLIPGADDDDDEDYEEDDYPRRP